MFTNVKEMKGFYDYFIHRVAFAGGERRDVLVLESSSQYLPHTLDSLKASHCPINTERQAGKL